MSAKLINEKFTMKVRKNHYKRMNITFLDLYYSANDCNVMCIAKCNKLFNLLLYIHLSIVV